MRPHVVAPAEYATLFDWTPPRDRKISLISFIAGSAILHALCFYVFQIVYPPTVALLPPPARVNVITPATEEGRLLLRWIAAEDPALPSTTQRPPDAAAVELPQPVHVPSYVSRQPALREAPPYQADLRVPSPQPPGPVPTSRPSPPRSAVVVPTTVTFGEEAARLGSPQAPRPEFATAGSELPPAAQFRLGISHHGQVRYCFVESSSGDAALDEQARSYLVRSRFPVIENRESKTENELRWTTAMIEWGNDIFAPLSVPASSPAP